VRPGRATPARRRDYAAYPGVRVGENQMEVRDRVQWGPILAGLATTIGSMVLLTVLGIALGASAMDRNLPGEDLDTWGAIWGIGSAILAFFLGGLVAAKSAAVGGQGTGMLNGLMVGMAAIALTLILAATGLGDLLGTLGAGIDDVIAAVPVADAAEGDVTFEQLEDDAWWILLALALPLVAATIGGWVGHNERRDLIEGTG
jgi:hypothetical protein